MTNKAREHSGEVSDNSVRLNLRPGTGGIMATESTATPESAVVIFTLRDDAATQGRAPASGVASFVVKRKSRCWR